MLTKRGFIAGAAAVTAVATTESWPSGLTTQPPAPVAAFDLVVFNERYADASQFAHALSGTEATLLPLAGDAGALWYNTLARQVAGGRRRFAGMGTSMDLFILETLARDAGLRVRFRGHHDCRGRATLAHSFHAQAGSLHVVQAVGKARNRWPATLATALYRTHFTIDWPEPQPLLSTTVPRSADHPGMLISWVLA